MKNLINNTISHYREDGKRKFLYRILRACIAESVTAYNRMKLIYLKIRFKKKEYVRKNILGSTMYLSTKDKGISWDLINFGFREPLSTKIMMNTLKRNDIVVDVGANIGYYALLESKLVGKNGKVYAIEPIPKNVSLLKKNIDVNNRSNIEIFEAAVGENNGEDIIFLSDKLNCASMFYRNGLTEVNGAIDTLSVKVVTLDTFLENKSLPNLIRMDVEGYELEVVKGMKNLLQVDFPLKIFIEVHPMFLGKARLFEMLGTLKNYGFHCELATDRPLYSKSNLLCKMFYFLSNKMNPISKDGYIYRNTNLDFLMEFYSQQIFPKVLFSRN